MIMMDDEDAADDDDDDDGCDDDGDDEKTISRDYISTLSLTGFIIILQINFSLSKCPTYTAAYLLSHNTVLCIEKSEGDFRWS